MTTFITRDHAESHVCSGGGGVLTLGYAGVSSSRESLHFHVDGEPAYAEWDKEPCAGRHCAMHAVGSDA